MTTGNPHILPCVTLPKHIIQSPMLSKFTWIISSYWWTLLHLSPPFTRSSFSENAFSSRWLCVKVDTVMSPSFGLQACSKLPQQGHRELLVHLETGRFHIWTYRRYRRWAMICSVSAAWAPTPATQRQLKLSTSTLCPSFFYLKFDQIRQNDHYVYLLI